MKHIKSIFIGLLCAISLNIYSQIPTPTISDISVTSVTNSEPNINVVNKLNSFFNNVFLNRKYIKDIHTNKYFVKGIVVNGITNKTILNNNYINIGYVAGNTYYPVEEYARVDASNIPDNSQYLLRKNYSTNNLVNHIDRSVFSKYLYDTNGTPRSGDLFVNNLRYKGVNSTISNGTLNFDNILTIQSNVLDQTENALMVVGAFGIGAHSPRINVGEKYTSINDWSIPNGNYFVYDQALGTRPSGVDNTFGFLTIQKEYTQPPQIPTHCTQSWRTHTTLPKLFIRNWYGGVYSNWTPWVEVGNLDSKFDFTGEQVGQYLQFNGTKYIPSTIDPLSSKFNFTGEQDGQFLQFNVGEGKYKPVSSTVDNHKLFSSTHSEDVDYTNALSYGDSMMWNGDKWQPGKFGDWAYDMEYVGITNTSIINWTVANSQTSVTYSVSGFAGPSVVANNIRWLAVRSSIYQYGFGDASGFQLLSSLLSTMPDGITHSLVSVGDINGFENYSIFNEKTLYVPINAGQNSITFTLKNEVTRGYVGTNSFVVVGALQTKKQALSPDVEFEYISSVTPNPGTGVVTPNTGCTIIRYSKIGNVTSNNWSAVLPLTVSNNITKTVIRSTYNSSGSVVYFPTISEITINWVDNTISGIAHSDPTQYVMGYLYSSNINGNINFVFDNNDSFYNAAKLGIGISGRTITNLPYFYAGYTYDAVTHSITHYKTSANAPGTFLAATNGYEILPSGRIEQWGVSTAGTHNISFPIPFPNACLNVTLTYKSDTSNQDYITLLTRTPTKTGFTGTGSSGLIWYWRAIGY